MKVYVTVLLILIVSTATAQVVRVGEVSRDFELTNRIDQSPIKLSDYEGHVIVLDFFAWWCGPCRRSSPVVEQDIYQYFESRDGNHHGVPVAVIAVNIESDNPARTDEFVEKSGLELVGDDIDREAWDQFKERSAIPLFVIINGVKDNSEYEQWEVLYKKTGFEGVKKFREIINKVQPGVAPPEAGNQTVTISLSKTEVYLGEKVTFFLSHDLVLPVTYQWIKGDSNIPGANQNSYTIVNVKKQDAGIYEVLVSSNHGSIKSKSVMLTVLEPDDETNPPVGIPAITKQPKSKTVGPGKNMTFLVEATGAEPMTYQWFQDQVKLVGKVEKSLSISNVDSSKHIGQYTVVVKNSFGSVKSDAAQLNVMTESELYITKKIFMVGNRLVFQAETPMTGRELDVERSFDFNNWEKVRSVASVGLITVVVDMENDKRMFYRLKIVD